jgi:hypothetical protein
MQGVLLWIGRFAGIFGVVLVVAAALIRVSGRFFVAGFQIGTVLQAGMAMMVVACLAYLIALVECPRK